MRDDQVGQNGDTPAAGRAGQIAIPLQDGALELELDQSGGLHRPASNEGGTDGENAVIRQRVLELQSEHLALDTLIAKLIALPGVNDFELRRLKKRKLKVKDTIMLLQLQLEPDARA